MRFQTSCWTIRNPAIQVPAIEPEPPRVAVFQPLRLPLARRRVPDDLGEAEALADRVQHVEELELQLAALQPFLDHLGAINVGRVVGGGLDRFGDEFGHARELGVGVEVGGAVKNVLAIACGLADGLGLGDNCRAALITRGLAEMMRLGAALGADPRTLTGLAGVGDLVLTCTGDLSRNRRFGMALARGGSVDSAVAEIGQVVEGIEAAREVGHLAERWSVELPISEQVHGILYRGWSAEKGVRVLLERDLKAENA